MRGTRSIGADEPPLHGNRTGERVDALIKFSGFELYSLAREKSQKSVILTRDVGHEPGLFDAPDALAANEVAADLGGAAGDAVVRPDGSESNGRAAVSGTFPIPKSGPESTGGADSGAGARNVQASKWGASDRSVGASDKEGEAHKVVERFAATKARADLKKLMNEYASAAFREYLQEKNEREPILFEKRWNGAAFHLGGGSNGVRRKDLCGAVLDPIPAIAEDARRQRLVSFTSLHALCARYCREINCHSIFIRRACVLTSASCEAPCDLFTDRARAQIYILTSADLTCGPDDFPNAYRTPSISVI